MPSHLVIAIGIYGLVIGFGICVESFRRHARATKIAERERRKAQERRMSPDRHQVAERRHAKRRHRSRHR